MALTVLRGGFATTVQDLGRPGYRSSGVALGGALDAHALRVANLLVGNEESAAGLEITMGGLRLQPSDERWLAWCGGAFRVQCGSNLHPAGRPFRVRDGDSLAIDGLGAGCRAWLAISGGIDVPPVLGSRSTDIRSGFGGMEGRFLRDGDLLPLGMLPRQHPVEPTGLWSASREWVSTASPSGRYVLRVVPGSDRSRFGEAASFSEAFTVTPDCDRMGVRLRGASLVRTDAGADLISEAVTPGTIQVPPNGQPIVLLNDCQTIGGYPKIAHVITVDLQLAAQLRPDDQVSFSEVPLAMAQGLLLQRERDIARFKVALQFRMSA